jgi:serine/threonine protein kinase
LEAPVIADDADSGDLAHESAAHTTRSETLEVPGETERDALEETRAEPLDQPPTPPLEETRRDPDDEAPDTPESIRATARLVRRSSARIMAEQVDMGLRRRGGAGLKQLGPYELRDLLGRGGSGSVYRAWDPRHEREVAVKILLHSDDPKARRRFEREIKATARLRHPTIVPLLDSGEEDGMLYLVMGLVEGRDLVACAQDGMSPLDVCLVMREICRAIHFAHEQGILHRDIKPQNVLIDDQGKPLVVDFGLARLEERDSHLTKTGTALGTPAYMPPEQVQAGRGEVLDARSDVYSLGATLYHALAKRAPFRSDSADVLFACVLAKDPDPPSAHVAGVPAELDTVCLKCLAKDPADRYQSAAALADELDRFAHGEPILARPLSRLGRARRWCRRNPALVGLILALVGSVTALGALGTYVLSTR